MPRALARFAGLLLCALAALLNGCAGHEAPMPQNTSAHAPRVVPSARAKLLSAPSGNEPTAKHTGFAEHDVAAKSTDAPEEAAVPVLAPVRPGLLERCDAPRSIVIAKAARRMELRCGDEVAARYPISLGFTPAGHKHHEGDGRTPEGRYYITSKFRSRFHRSLELSYPNIRDAERGLAEGQISRAQHNHIVRALRSCKRPPQTTALGSLLQIHGGGGGQEAGDWTLGCVATDKPAIEAVYAFHQPGCDADGPRTPVIITP